MSERMIMVYGSNEFMKKLTNNDLLDTIGERIEKSRGLANILTSLVETKEPTECIECFYEQVQAFQNYHILVLFL